MSAAILPALLQRVHPQPLFVSMMYCWLIAFITTLGIATLAPMVLKPHDGPTASPLGALWIGIVLIYLMADLATEGYW